MAPEKHETPLDLEPTARKKDDAIRRITEVNQGMRMNDICMKVKNMIILDRRNFFPHLVDFLFPFSL